MSKAEMNKELTEAMRNFSAAYSVLRVAIDRYEQETGTSVNDLKDFTERYPFDKSFDELEVGQWVANVVEGLRQPAFKVLNYTYLNTGGNCMVGIHEVWLPDEKRVVYALTNEEGCTLSVVDYISNELDIDDYDELFIDSIDWGRVTGHEKYFELYRYCLTEYTRDDCKYFGITRRLPYYLLSDELQKNVTEDYLKWSVYESDGLFEIDGKNVVEDPDYTQHTNEVKLANELDEIKAFRDWHGGTAADELLYDEYYTVTFAGHTVRLPYCADSWNAIDDLLLKVIENW